MTMSLPSLLTALPEHHAGWPSARVKKTLPVVVAGGVVKEPDQLNPGRAVFCCMVVAVGAAGLTARAGPSGRSRPPFPPFRRPAPGGVTGLYIGALFIRSAVQNRRSA